MIKIKNLPILNNLHGWAISQKMPVGSFKWIENASPFGKDFIGNCNEDSPVDTGQKLNVLKTFRRRPGPLLNVLCTFNLRPVSTESDEKYFLDFDVQYPEKLHGLHNDLPVFPEIMKTKKVEKLLPNLLDKNEYVIHIRNLKQALNNGLVLKKVPKIIKLNQFHF